MISPAPPRAVQPATVQAPTADSDGELFHVSFRLSDADIVRIDRLAKREAERRGGIEHVSRTAMLRILIRDRARREGIS